MGRLGSEPWQCVQCAHSTRTPGNCETWTNVRFRIQCRLTAMYHNTSTEQQQLISRSIHQLRTDQRRGHCHVSCQLSASQAMVQPHQNVETELQGKTSKITNA